MTKKLIICFVGALTISLLFSNIILAQDSSSSNAGLTPDSPFYFLKSWKESIQTFFTFGLENKAKQYLHLAEVRLAEYQKMIEKGKTEIAQRILEKYENQLNNALNKAAELGQSGKDIKDLSQKIEETIGKHLQVLQENLRKVPEQAKKGIENAIENSQKVLQKIPKKSNVYSSASSSISIDSIIKQSGFSKDEAELIIKTIVNAGAKREEILQINKMSNGKVGVMIGDSNFYGPKEGGVIGYSAGMLYYLIKSGGVWQIESKSSWVE